MPSALSLRLVVLAAASAAAATTECPSGWHQYRDKCYWVSNYTLNGRSVPAVCASMITGAEPVSIHDLDLDAFIAEDLAKGEQVWLGLYRATTNTDWSWLDGSPMNFTMWHEGQPNTNGDACGSINWDKTGFWSDEHCDTYYYFFLCQIDV